LFALKAQDGLRTIPGLANSRLIVTVSSRSTYNTSRLSAGHDQSYNEPIRVNVGALGAAPLAVPVAPAPLPGGWWTPIPRVILLPTVVVAPGAGILGPPSLALAAPIAADPRLPVVPTLPHVVSCFNTVFPDKPSLQHFYSRLPG
jgi:hypothetical protein